ncbi:MAG: carboxymuconolactone decarboxylase family protein [Terriglobia bacterium]
MRGSVSKTRKYRSDMNDKILNSGFQEFNKFFAADARAYVKGALDVRTKEMMGLVASMVLRCNDCIFYHLDRCVSEGCSRKELNEAMHIALIVGGSIVIPHLRYAFEVLEELFEGSGKSPGAVPSHTH